MELASNQSMKTLPTLLVLITLLSCNTKAPPVPTGAETNTNTPPVVTPPDVISLDNDNDGILTVNDCDDNNSAIGSGTAVYSKNDILSDLQTRVGSDYKDIKVSYDCGSINSVNLLVKGSIEEVREGAYFYHHNGQNVFSARTYPGQNDANAISTLTTSTNSLPLNTYSYFPSGFVSALDEKDAESEILSSPNGAYILFERNLDRTSTTVSAAGYISRNYTLGNFNQLYVGGMTSLRVLPVSVKKDLNNFGDLVVEKRIYSLVVKNYVDLASYNGSDVLSINLSSKLALLNNSGSLVLFNYESKKKVMDVNIDVGTAKDYYLRGSNLFVVNDINQLQVYKLDSSLGTSLEVLNAALSSEGFNSQSMSADGRYVTFIDNGIVVMDLENKIKTNFSETADHRVLSVHVSLDGKSLYAYTESFKADRSSDVVTWINPLNWINL